MADYDNTNTAVAFVEANLFNQDVVATLGNKPVVTVKVNIDGVDKDVALWLSTDKETGELRVTKNGGNMLTGKVQEPYVAPAS